MDLIKLQYQLSNGNWADCNRNGSDRTEEFLLRCEKFNGISADSKIVPIFRAARPLTRDDVIIALLDGQILRNDKDDWYSNCRSGSAYEEAITLRRANAVPIKMVKCSCGHTIPSGSVMSASTGSSCPDCYDRMSM
jgi:hypothetical protein